MLHFASPVISPTGISRNLNNALDQLTDASIILPQGLFLVQVDLTQLTGVKVQASKVLCNTVSRPQNSLRTNCKTPSQEAKNQLRGPKIRGGIPIPDMGPQKAQINPVLSYWFQDQCGVRLSKGAPEKMRGLNINSGPPWLALAGNFFGFSPIQIG